MDAVKKMLTIGASSMLALGGTVSAFAATSEAEAQPVGDPTMVNEQIVSEESSIVKMTNVEGRFAYTQLELASKEVVAKLIGGAAQYLCNGLPVEVAGDESAERWSLDVRGAVANPGAISLAEFRDSGYAKTLVMGCSCMGNPIDGQASVNAEVTGIPLNDLFDVVLPNSSANTIVFTSSDGYEVALPLSYVVNRCAAIVFAVDGSPLVESVGGVNQLWLGSTPASYFARDIVTIELEERQTPPPSPSSEEGRAQLQNLPNIGVLYGGSIR